MIVGLTGGVGTGKSTAASALMRIGVRVLDCDVIAHFLADYDPHVHLAIRELFGADVFHAHGALDRARLADLVFHDAAQRESLEAILHPPILDLVRQNVDQARSEGEHLVVVIPLLFELSLQELFDETWLVQTSPAVQLERLQAHRGYSLEQAKQRIAAQWSLDRKVALATRVLNNDATIADFDNTVISTWESLTAA